MTKGLSIYLDLMRFTLAVIVWICHSTYRGYTGHPFALWFVFPYGLSAVMSFFVLSGFVIAHVTEKTERDPIPYAIARVSRLYSVIIPALALTAACDWAGTLTHPPFEGPVALPDHLAQGYLASFFMVNNFWIFASGIFPAGMTPGTNGPFWSLSYEMAYYVIFGLYLTRSRTALALGTILIFALAGWDILALFPIWLLGVITYHVQKRHRLHPAIAATLFVSSAGAAVLVGWLRLDYDYSRGMPLAIDYAVAILTALNIIAASSLSGWLAAALATSAPLIRWLGGLTFVIYLCHYPLLKLFAAYPVGQAGSAAQQVWLFGGSFMVMAALAKATNIWRSRLRLALLILVRRVSVAPSPISLSK
jgi:peptidoglycan/LPS O-acetylase OafA/YrhL